MKTRIFLVDDEVMVRTGLRMILEGQDDLEVVGEASDGREAVASVTDSAAEIVLMDIRMPAMDGIEATRLLVETGSPAKIIVLTTFDLDEHVLEALRAGASGFLTKDSPADKLLEAVRVVAAGGALLAPKVTKRLLSRFAEATPRVSEEAAQRLASLTEREMDVFKKVAGGLSNDEIARGLFITEATVKTHVSNILAKLQLRDRVQAVVFAYETGTARPGT